MESGRNRKFQLIFFDGAFCMDAPCNKNKHLWASSYSETSLLHCLTSHFRHHFYIKQNPTVCCFKCITICSWHAKIAVLADCTSSVCNVTSAAGIWMVRSSVDHLKGKKSTVILVELSRECCHTLTSDLLPSHHL